MTCSNIHAAHKAGLVDYGSLLIPPSQSIFGTLTGAFATHETARIMLLRTASDFDRAPNVTVDAYTAFEAEQGGFEPAIQNILITGRPVVEE